MKDCRDMPGKRLRELEVKIRGTRKRLPANSVKPPVMMKLLDLENESHALRRKLETIKNGSPDAP